MNWSYSLAWIEYELAELATGVQIPVGPLGRDVISLQSTDPSFSGFQYSDERVQTLLETIQSRPFLSILSKNTLQELVTLFSQERKRRYKRKKDRKYGNINKGFTEVELKKFLSCCTHPKANLAFHMQAYLGLRIGEAVKVKLEDIDLPRKKLSVQTEKARTGDSLYLHDEISEKLKIWIDTHYDDILSHNGYVLYSENQATTSSHVSPHWLRNEFREAVILAGLNEWYSKSDESSRPIRKLHRLTSHSLRHFFITKVYRATKDPVVAQKLARHTDIKSTQVYIHTAQRDLDVSMSTVFEKGLVEKQKEQDELKKLVEIWRIMK